MDQRYSSISRAFFSHHRVSSDALMQDFRAEIIAYAGGEWSTPSRAARLSAAVKRFKTSRAIEFVIKIAEIEGLDITPTLAKKLSHMFFGRFGSQKIMVSIFGTAGRMSKSKSNQPELLGKIHKKYKNDAELWQSETDNEIADVKRRYQDMIHQLND